MHVDVYDGFNLHIYILHITYIIVRNPDLSN